MACGLVPAFMVEGVWGSVCGPQACISVFGGTRRSGMGLFCGSQAWIVCILFWTTSRSTLTGLKCLGGGAGAPGGAHGF